jgi:hypothetical protein
LKEACREEVLPQLAALWFLKEFKEGWEFSSNWVGQEFLQQQLMM